MILIYHTRNKVLERVIKSGFVCPSLWRIAQFFTSSLTSSSFEASSSTEFLGSRRGIVIRAPITERTASIIIMFFTPMVTSSVGNRNVVMAAPILPDAADMPCPVVLQVVGKPCAGTTNVVVLGPKSMKKYVST